MDRIALETAYKKLKSYVEEDGIDNKHSNADADNLIKEVLSIIEQGLNDTRVDASVEERAMDYLKRKYKASVNLNANEFLDAKWAYIVGAEEQKSY